MEFMLVLGVIPGTVREVVRKLVDAAREEHAGSTERFLGYPLWGGPGGSDYIDMNGEVWSWCPWDETVEHIPDGPRKVGAIAIAARRVPELSAWLPRRPAGATDCQACNNSGWLQLSLREFLCPKCHGMGWLSD